MSKLKRATLAGAVLGSAALAGISSGSLAKAEPAGATTTPIKHLVVIFQENVSFDHYFATYPNAANTDGQPFKAAAGTPAVNGLSGGLLTSNPNASNPQRLTNSQAATCDQGHGYTAEQKAFDNGLMDQFVPNTGRGLTLQQCLTNEGNTKGLASGTGTNPNYAVMDYYDGNTVTALWNYAQHYAMSDNSYSTNFGPSTPGAVNVTAANTYGTVCGPASAAYNTAACTAPTVTPTTTTVNPTPGSPQPAGVGTMYSDADPYYDVCSSTQDAHTAAQDMQQGGRNLGDALDTNNLTWGWFQGGFASPNYVPGKPDTSSPSTACTGAHQNILGTTVKDYSPHHEPFQYYQSTSNPQHLPPASIANIGHQDQANHQYDVKDFWAAAGSNNLPAVSYVKAPEYQDGHAGYSDPIDEQRFLADTINRLQSLPSWSSTAVVVAYDDSDGWYDHQMSPILTQSQTPLDSLTGAEPQPQTGDTPPNSGQCGTDPNQVPKTTVATSTTPAGTPEQARCGYGPRQPLLVVSPFAKSNFVDDTTTDQSSVVRFIEDNWLHAQRMGNGGADQLAGTLTNMMSFSHPQAGKLFLDPQTGQPSNRGQTQGGQG